MSSIHQNVLTTIVNLPGNRHLSHATLLRQWRGVPDNSRLGSFLSCPLRPVSAFRQKAATGRHVPVYVPGW